MAIETLIFATLSTISANIHTISIYNKIFVSVPTTRKNHPEVLND